MKLKHLIVYISYRIEAGDQQPGWKILRARVMEETADKNHPQFGRDLFPPSARGFYDVEMLKKMCHVKLAKYKCHVEFRYSPPLLKAMLLRAMTGDSEIPLETFHEKRA